MRRAAAVGDNDTIRASEEIGRAEATGSRASQLRFDGTPHEPDDLSVVAVDLAPLSEHLCHCEDIAIPRHICACHCKR